MPSLHEILSQFTAGINRTSEDILLHIKQTPKLSEKDHFSIYQNSIQGGLQNALIKLFPVCHKLVGNDFFVAMANAYIHSHISKSPDIADYGKHFAKCISEFSPANVLPYLSDVARLEWAWHIAFYARNSGNLDFKKLAECYTNKGEKIIFSLPPNSTLLLSPYPIHLIWKVNQEDYTGEPTVTLENDRKFYLFIWRKNLEMHIDVLTKNEWSILQWIQDKIPLNKLCHNITHSLNDTSLTELLPHLVRKGWIAGFDILTREETAQ